MIFSVDMTQPSKIDFAPATVAAEVAQNIRTILTTPIGSAPLARSIGIDNTMIDEAPAIAEARLVAEITAAIAAQEPRAVVSEVLINGDPTAALAGRLPAIVRYSLADGVT
ncbi:lysozyme [Cohnella sp. GCM10012308]|uniref:lysozyme n=1 Tax=Cohnella sp. GCM10012308 TaxID=3317329 RepID=UPI003615C732